MTDGDGDGDGDGEGEGEGEGEGDVLFPPPQAQQSRDATKSLSSNKDAVTSHKYG